MAVGQAGRYGRVAEVDEPLPPYLPVPQLPDPMTTDTPERTRSVAGLAEAAGIAPYTPHDLRRTFISELLDVADGETARRLARHSPSDVF